MKKSFFEYFIMKESAEEKDGKTVPTELKLSDNGEFKPFVVNKDVRSNLRPIIKAFLDSGNITLPGLRPGEKLTSIGAKGEEEQKMKKKTLYLTGGAVRDHLKGKTPKDYDLATDATPAEIRLILSNAGFKETAPLTGKHAPKGIEKKYNGLGEGGSKSKIFYAKGWDRAGNEFVIGAKVNGEEFEIATFRKDSKGSDGRTPDKMEFAGIDEDSKRRDFTINSMYIPLTNPDGPNGKLIDNHGGAHHLQNGEVKFVGDPKARLEEDQLRALRYIRFATAHGKTDVPEEIKKAIEEIKDLPAISRERVREEFIKGLSNPDIDPKKYIQMYKNLDLLGSVFPNMQFALESPEDFSGEKEKRLAVAWLLRNNEPESIAQMLKNNKWENNEINDIINLIKLNNWGTKYRQDPLSFQDGFYDLKNNITTKSNLVPSLIKKWSMMTGIDQKMIEKFLKHSLATKGYIRDEFGNQIVNPALVSIYGRTPVGPEFGQGIKK